jgi:hypothetical protein
MWSGRRGAASRSAGANQDDPSLVDLAAKIKVEHEAAIGTARTTLKHAMAAGDLLIKAKELVGHGKWLAWLKANCEFSKSTAENYMRLAKSRSKLETKSTTVGNLGVREAVGLIAKPKKSSPASEAKVPSSLKPETHAPDLASAPAPASALASYNAPKKQSKQILGHIAPPGTAREKEAISSAWDAASELVKQEWVDEHWSELARLHR